MVAKQYLLRLTAFGSLGAFMFMSVSGAWGMFPGDDQVYARWTMVGIAVLVDMAAIGFMMCFYDAHEEGEWGSAIAFFVLWMGLSGGAIYTAKGWVEAQDFKAWFPTEVLQSLLEGDKKELVNAKAAAKHPMNKKERKETAQAVKDAKTAIVDDAEKVAKKAPVKNWVKGNEVGLPLILLIIAHMSLKGLRGKRKAEVPAWRNARDITPPAVPANVSAATPPPSLPTPTPPPPSGKKPENPRISAENSGNVVDFAARRKRKMPTAEEVSAMRAIDEATGKPRYTYEEIAAHFGCCEKTCRNRVAAVKRRQAAMQSAAA